MKVNLFIAITEDCNLDCEYCNVSKSKNNISLKDAIKSIHYFIKFFKKAEGYNIFFIWWEPLIKFNLLKILIFFIKKLEFNLKREFKIHLVTNGTLLDRKKLDFFYKYWVQISLSLDSLDINYNYRNFRNSILSSSKNLVPNISLFLEYRDIIRIKMVVVPWEVKKMYENYKNIFNVWFNFINIQPAHWVFWSKKDINDYKIQYMKIKENIINEKGVFSTTFKWTHTSDRKKQKWCAKWKSEIFIDSYWYVYVCDAFLAYPYEKRRLYSHDTIYKNDFNKKKFNNYSNWKYCNNMIIWDKKDLINCSKCEETMTCSKLCNAIPTNWGILDLKILQSNFELLREIDFL